MVNRHLVILKGAHLEAILRGEKRVESRFARRWVAPFGRVFRGDELFLKASGGPVCGRARVERIEQFVDLEPGKVMELKALYNGQVGASEGYWSKRRGCRYGMFLWLGDVRRTEPVRIEKRDWRAWVVLREGRDFGLLGS
jgi:hypothetical protein